ncbi:succinate dehydrogenase [Rhizobium sp. WYCCWR 11279]|uniref:succinate dehydrogenase n=1 Tax=Rhizobium changzhiense TaxID=2692317 RepID=UPI0014926DB6|nr:succinate dehydrogenase [Rhizobium changzhiense]NNU50275.1 succinate dehydrogenase [Rhizobium changzhiense]
MKKAVFLSIVAVTLMVSSSALPADHYKLRAPGGVGAATSNEVGVWNSAKAAKAAHDSLVVGNQFMSKYLACVVRPGTKADVLERSGAVAFVRASNAVFGGCKGYVKTEFLSAN